jgi:hypothetical protein
MAEWTAVLWTLCVHYKVLAVPRSAVVGLEDAALLDGATVHGFDCFCGGSLLEILNVGTHPVGADAVGIVGDHDVPYPAVLAKPLLAAQRGLGADRVREPGYIANVPLKHADSEQFLLGHVAVL